MQITASIGNRSHNMTPPLLLLSKILTLRLSQQITASLLSIIIGIIIDHHYQQLKSTATTSCRNTVVTTSATNHDTLIVASNYQTNYMCVMRCCHFYFS